MDDYMHFVTPLCNQLHEEGKELLYMHFSGHSALLQAGNGIRVYEFDPSEGFEAFTMNVRRRIKAEGRDAFYVFDCLSDLQAAWATDLMMGNFFKVTCPYLFELNTVAYFPLLRGQHSFARIQETTQLLLDVYTDSESLYINPLKVWNRYSPNMFLPHKYMEENGSFLPLKGDMRLVVFIHWWMHLPTLLRTRTWTAGNASSRIPGALTAEKVSLPRRSKISFPIL